MNSTIFSISLLEKIINQLPNYVFVKDAHGRYQFCNANFSEVVGLENPHDIHGKTDYDMSWANNSAEIYVAEDKHILATGQEISNKEVPMIFPHTSEVRWLSVSKSPLYDDKNKIIGILGIYIDITEQKRALLVEKEKEIAEKNAKIMDVLSSSVAHEIRTPLAIIKINADLIDLLKVAEHISIPEDKIQFLSRMKNIQQALKECSQVIEMLLVKLRKISTLGADQTPLETCSIREIIQMVLAEYPFRENEKEKIHYKPSAKDFHFQGHTRLTKHILFNLLRNALHVIGEAEKGEIFIECRTENNVNCLVFKDTSIGIEESYLAKIFDKFETTDDARSGTGLGLAFCKLVMESFGGQIKCYSEVNKYTEFVLLFPRG